MHKEPKALAFDEFADELLVEKQPRALVILACAKIDTQLRKLIETVLLPKAAKTKEPDELLDGDSPLSTFSSRIKMCRRLGLLDVDLLGALDKLRDIRNQAAHWISFGVSDAPLRDQVRNLRSLVESRRSYSLTVSRFLIETELTEFESLQAVLLTLCVLIESVQCAADGKSLSRTTKPPKLN
jgi:hypothetical protein